MMGILVLLVLVVAVSLYFIGIYNRLIRLRNEKDNAWSQIDVQLKRRHDLVPNLVETVKGYAQHEGATLEAVVRARNTALAANGPAEVSAAEGALGAALGRLIALSEAYPDLKANTNFLALQEELTSTENKIGFARQAFNDATTAYNNAREVFPASLVAGAFEKGDLFEIADASERDVPKVDFGSRDD